MFNIIIFYAKQLKVANFYAPRLNSWLPYPAAREIHQTNVGVVPARLAFVISVRGAGDALVTGAVEDNWV